MPPVTLDKETRLVFEDRVQVPRLYIAVADRRREERRPVRARRCSTPILAGPRTARLTKALVYDQQAAASRRHEPEHATRTSASSASSITPRPGHSLTELEAAADAILEKLKAEGPTAEEIQRATAGLELGFVSGLQSNLGKSFTLADGAGFHGDPGYFQTEYQKLLAGDAGRRQARREQVPDAGPRRA